MDLTVGALGLALLGALYIAARRLINAGTDWLELRIRASAERSRRRDLKRTRREEGSGLLLPSGKPASTPEHIDEETTDMHELVELEREQERERRSQRASDQPPFRMRLRGGTRAPRPGTHHDREDE